MLVIVGSPICWWHRTCLVVQDHAEEATLNRQPAVAAVIDKAKLSELVHKMTDLRPGEASELSQLCLINFGNCSFGSSFLCQNERATRVPGPDASRWSRKTGRPDPLRIGCCAKADG